MKENKKCALCGKEFVANYHNEKYCSDYCREKPYTCKCTVCGKEFRASAKSYKHCSDKCKKEDLLKKECVVCEKTFIANSSNQKYCSDECREKAYECICIICEEKFRASSKKYKYCSDKCRKEDLLKKECVVCGKKIIVDHASQKYCSDECREKAHKCICIICGDEFRTYNKINKYCSEECKNNHFIEKKCSTCNENFKVLSKNSNIKYCSKECREIGYSHDSIKPKSIEDLEYIIEFKVRNLVEKGMQIGEIIQGAILNYWSIRFSEKVKNEIKERDKWKCWICGENKSLEVHHIIPRKFGGTHKKNNLITLCTKCHRAIETRDIAHAVKKCIKYAKRNFFKKDVVKNNHLTNKKKISNAISDLNKVYSKVSKVNHEDVKDILKELDNIISYLE